jgi:hypothetical protein
MLLALFWLERWLELARELERIMKLMLETDIPSDSSLHRFGECLKAVDDA